MEDKAAIGGQTVVLECPNCGHKLKIVDPDVTDFGPIRCGACGTEVQSSHIRRLVDDSRSGRRR